MLKFVTPKLVRITSKCYGPMRSNKLTNDNTVGLLTQYVLEGVTPVNLHVNIISMGTGLTFNFSINVLI